MDAAEAIVQSIEQAYDKGYGKGREDEKAEARVERLRQLHQEPCAEVKRIRAGLLAMWDEQTGTAFGMNYAEKIDAMLAVIDGTHRKCGGPLGHVCGEAK